MLPVIPMAMVLQVALLVAGCAAGSSIPADHLGAPHKWVQAEQCSFANPPVVPYYWDPNCTNDLTSLGCWADGVHAECRFCGGRCELRRAFNRCDKAANLSGKGGDRGWQRWVVVAMEGGSDGWWWR